jgi:hypothetical protein
MFHYNLYLYLFYYKNIIFKFNKITSRVMVINISILIFISAFIDYSLT